MGLFNKINRPRVIFKSETSFSSRGGWLIKYTHTANKIATLIVEKSWSTNKSSLLIIPKDRDKSRFSL